MNDLTDPRPPLPEWILSSYDLLCTHSRGSDENEDVKSISRERAFEILLESDELMLEPADVEHAITRLLERGYFYEVNDELRITLSEN